MRAISLSAAVLLSALAHAQLPRTSETIEVSIVNVDVVVTDAKGNHVSGLEPEDFEVRERGKLQPITNFSEYGPVATAGDVPDAAPAPPPARAPRTLVFFIESTPLPSTEAKELFDGMRALVREAVTQDDRAMIVSWDHARDRSVLRQPLTNDVAALEKVLTELEREHGGVRADEADLGAREQRAAQMALEQLNMEDLELPAADWSAWMSLDDNVKALRQLISIRRKAGALQALMSSIAAFEGRKVLVMSLRRFGAHAGAEFFRGVVPDDRAGELDTLKIQDALIRTANANNIVLYPMHPAGLGSRPAISASVAQSFAGTAADPGPRFGATTTNILLNELVALQNMAVKTGGLATSGAENVVKVLRRVSDDLQSYYSLGYRASAPRDDTPRAITVRMKDRRYQVRARRQVVEKSDETVMKERLISNLHGYLEADAIRFGVQFGAVTQKAKKRWEVPMEIRFPIGALTILPDGENGAGSFSVYVMVDTMAEANEAHHGTRPFEIPARELEAAKKSVFSYNLTLQLDEHARAVSVAVVDETAKTFGMKRLLLPARSK